MIPFTDARVEEKFYTYPKDIKDKLLSIRKLIFKVAESLDGVGKIDETLKWGEPSYVTSETKSGSTIRMDWKMKNPDKIMVYFNCKTTLVYQFKEIYGDLFEYEGNRAIVFNRNSKIPVDEISYCISMALTYHINKKKKQLV
ncbi:MAG: DUF1801 domain-containing protein [Legionellales bacterium]|nr:DUF1801 domain-containing protein [Legionellales bacterium]